MFKMLCLDALENASEIKNKTNFKSNFQTSVSSVEPEFLFPLQTELRHFCIEMCLKEDPFKTSKTAGISARALYLK